ncbi:hypothetical protein P4S73_07780 [Paraglaciecola sp. Hal342]
MNKAAVEHDFIPIDASHLLTVWQWRNSDRVRENMHYDKLITWDEHGALVRGFVARCQP